MAPLGLLGLPETEVTPEKMAALEDQVWQGLAFPCLARCLLPTATSTRCATMPREMTDPTGWPVLRPSL